MIRFGILTPHTAIGPEAELPEMAAGRIVTRIVRVDGGVHALVGSEPMSMHARPQQTIPPVVERSARKLSEGGVDAIGLASTTSAYAIGFDAESVMVSRLSQITGLPVASTCAAAVLALHVLEVRRVALIGAPWFSPESNQAATDYFREQSFEIVSSASAGLSLDPGRIEPNGVHDWVSRHVGANAQAVFLGGNGFRTVGAIERLEATLGRPVLTANQVLFWKLLADTGDQFTIDGFGTLFSHRPGST